MKSNRYIYILLDPRFLFCTVSATLDSVPRAPRSESPSVKWLRTTFVFVFVSCDVRAWMDPYPWPGMDRTLTLIKRKCYRFSMAANGFINTAKSLVYWTLR